MVAKGSFPVSRNISTENKHFVLTKMDHDEHILDASVSEFSHTDRASAPRVSRCVNLTTLATKICTAPDQRKTADELCTACCKIDLSQAFRPFCSDHRPHHYHLGKVEGIRARTSCPLCRLISAIHNSAGFNLTDASAEECDLVVSSDTNDIVKIHFTRRTSKWDVENKAAVHGIRLCLDDGILDSLMNEFRSAWLETSPSEPFYMLKFVGGRRMDPRRVDPELIRGWLHQCETSHGDRCGRSRLMPKAASRIRLIDVLNRQIVDVTTEERYVALSYVWGPERYFCLSRQNHDDLRMPQSLRAEDMPGTLRDAFNLVARIGELYLWVDRLCILMDDERDKLEQMASMDHVYNSATLTIVNATTTCCSNAPILGVEPDTRSSFQHSEVIRGVRYITTHSDPVPQVLASNWSTRGWTYQEGFLSPRCLVFTWYQAYFQCKSEVWSEDSYSFGSPPGEGKRYIGNKLCHLPDTGKSKIRCSFYQYIDAIEAFSKRQFKVDTDALWAFTGVAKAFQPQFGGDFAWGLPSANLDAALLWNPSHSPGGPRGGSHSLIVDSQMMQLPFPTWSWVSWRGGVKFTVKCEEDVVGMVEWRQPLRYVVNTTRPFSEPWIQAADYDKPIISPYTLMDERDLGFLRLTAASVTLDIEIIDCDATSTASPNRCSLCDNRPMCNIRTRAGKMKGSIHVPRSWFDMGSCRQGEFILLSKCVENAESETCRAVWDMSSPNYRTSMGIKHVENCLHQSMYNIMLIDWKEEPYGTVATRIALTQIQKMDWAELESFWKLIVLS